MSIKGDNMEDKLKVYGSPSPATKAVRERVAALHPDLSAEEVARIVEKMIENEMLRRSTN
jgi:hypothetical protein